MLGRPIEGFQALAAKGGCVRSLSLGTEPSVAGIIVIFV